MLGRHKVIKPLVVRVAANATGGTRSNTVVRFVTETRKRDAALPSGPRAAGDFTGKAGQCSVEYGAAKSADGKPAQRTIFVGLGDARKVSQASLRVAVARAAAQLRALRIEHAAWALGPLFGVVRDGDGSTPSSDVRGLLTSGSAAADAVNTRAKEAPLPPVVASVEVVRSVAAWLTALNFVFTDHRAPRPRETPMHSATLIVGGKAAPAAGAALVSQGAFRRAARDGAVIGAAVAAARRLGNQRSDVATPLAVAQYARRLFGRGGGTGAPAGRVRVAHWLRGRQLLRRGLRMHFAVGQGSHGVARQPQLLVLEYIGCPSQQRSVAFVGKGLTYDTGGLHVKPFGAMETMHQDKMGAVAVLHALHAAARLRLRVNVVAVLAIAENAIGPNAYYPGNILRSLKGSSVEVLNTDAEGRLVLGDAITFVQRHARLRRRPDTVIDLATLTGAISVALGNDRAGLFSNTHRLTAELCRAGSAVLEPVWPLPVGPEHTEALKGRLSDLQNIPTVRFAGASTAAAFLQHFIEPGVAWAHLDIAGTAMNDKLPGATCQAGGVTGWGVALLVEFLRARAASEAAKRVRTAKKAAPRRSGKKAKRVSNKK